MAARNITGGQVLRACTDCSAAGYKPDGEAVLPQTLLAARTGQSIKMCLGAMDRAVRQGLVEYGASLRPGRRGAKGTALRRAELGAARGRRVTKPRS